MLYVRYRQEMLYYDGSNFTQSIIWSHKNTRAMGNCSQLELLTNCKPIVRSAVLSVQNRDEQERSYDRAGTTVRPRTMGCRTSSGAYFGVDQPILLRALVSVQHLSRGEMESK